MKLPYMNSVQSTQEQGNNFQGYQRTPFGSVNAFWDMQNMTGKDSPLIRTRDKRRKVRTLGAFGGMFGREALGWVDGTRLYYDGQDVGEVAQGQKTFVHMGAYTLIFPDKKMLNTQTLELTDLENRVTVTGEIFYTPSAMLGEEVEEGSETYIKVTAAGVGKGFKNLDVVTISGSVVESLNGSMQLQSVTDDEIILLGTLDGDSQSQTGGLTLERTVPDMDYLTESNNRVWGCSSANHEVYACKLGDPTNWHNYQGLADDAYALTLGSVGDFTGAVTHLGYVIFFKERVHHKLYGNKPSNFELANSQVRGVEAGSHGSLCIMNETLYYHSPDGMCASNGALPFSVNEALGDVQYKNVVCGSARETLWAGMEDMDGNHVLFAMDGKTGLWHKEDGVHAVAFANVDNHLYMADAGGVIWCLTGRGDAEWEDGTAAWEDALPFMVETGDLNMMDLYRKRLQKIHLRMTLEAGAVGSVSVQYDGGEWKELVTMRTGKDLKSMILPIVPRRCDRMRLRIHGSGMMRLYNLNIITQGGTEIG